MAASQAKINFVTQANNTANQSQASGDTNMIGASLNKITRNQLTGARLRSFERPNAAATGEENFSRLTLYTPSAGEEKTGTSTYRRPSQNRSGSRSPTKIKQIYSSCDNNTTKQEDNDYQEEVAAVIGQQGKPNTGIRPQICGAQDGINSIREEQDLEDSGAYGTTPSKHEGTLLAQEAQMVISTTNFESTTVYQSNAVREVESNVTSARHAAEGNSDLTNRIYLNSTELSQSVVDSELNSKQ